MKVFKQLAMIVLIFSLVLAGCSTGNNSDSNNVSAANSEKETAQNNKQETIKLTYWVPFSGSDGQFMEDMVTAFNQSQSEIAVEFLNNNHANYYPKLVTSLVGNSAPDIAVAHASKLSEVLPTNKVESLDELSEEAGMDWSVYADNQVNAVVRDGKHYAIPLDTHALIMYYNKKLLGDAGLLNADGSIKMESGAEGFTQVLRTLKSKLPDDVSPLVLQTDNIISFFAWYALVYQQGGQYLNDGKPTIDSPEGKKAAALIKSWVDEGLMLGDVGDNSYDLFKTQKTAITFTGVWATGNFETNDSLEFVGVPFPQLYDQPATWGDSHVLIVPKQADRAKQLAAVKFADWLTENGAMWAVAGHVPSRPSIMDTEAYKSLPYRADYAAVMDIVKYMPESTKLGPVNDLITESLVSILYGQASVDEGMQNAQESVEALLSR